MNPPEKFKVWKECPDCNGRGYFLINPFGAFMPDNRRQCDSCAEAHEVAAAMTPVAAAKYLSKWFTMPKPPVPMRVALSFVVIDPLLQTNETHKEAIGRILYDEVRRLEEECKKLTEAKAGIEAQPPVSEELLSRAKPGDGDMWHWAQNISAMLTHGWCRTCGMVPDGCAREGCGAKARLAAKVAQGAAPEGGVS